VSDSTDHTKHLRTFSPSELILNDDGSVYHLNLRPEHIADKIIAVGDPGRVYRISRYFDKIEFEMSRREFVTHTGTWKGKRITAISTGMGTDNIEIFMNEMDALVNIDLKNRRQEELHTSLKIVRLGTSGSLQEEIPVGSHLVSANAVGLDTLMAFYELPQSKAEAEISEMIKESLSLPFLPYCVSGSPILREQFAAGNFLEGNTVTCPGFYAPQGRELNYNLRQPKLLQNMALFHHNDFWLTNLEMETAGYYALGRILGHEILSLNAVLANRMTGEFSDNSNKIVDSLIHTVLELI
jgi:uridine phosphorylase